MEFKNPIFFILLLALVPYILWYVLKYKRSLPSLKVPETVKYRMAPKSFRLYLFHVPFLLRLVLFTLVVCILARPQSKHTWSDTDVEGIDIMLAVDVSTSMLAQDFKPNRVEALKAIAQQFIERRPNDNMGLTIFAGEAYTQCPLTTDHAVLMNLYSSVDCNMAARGIIDDGTAIGDGIMNAILRLKDSQAKSKVIILLTDGSNNAGDIISKETGGRYFRAQKNADLSAVYADIDKMERTKFNVKEFSKRSELFEPYALAAFIVLLLEILLRYIVLKRLP